MKLRHKLIRAYIRSIHYLLGKHRQWDDQITSWLQTQYRKPWYPLQSPLPAQIVEIFNRIQDWHNGKVPQSVITDLMCDLPDTMAKEYHHQIMQMILAPTAAHITQIHHAFEIAKPKETIQ